jgi:hypothetical protein
VAWQMQGREDRVWEREGGWLVDGHDDVASVGSVASTGIDK